MTRYLLLIFIGIIIFLMYWLKQPPFIISQDLALADNYQKKPFISPKDDFFTSFIRYDSEAKKFLDIIASEDLVAFRCSDNILRTNQGAYILKNAKTSEQYRRRIQNTNFISFMRNKDYSLPLGKKILTARICETENKTILLFYSIGTYDSANVDNNTILQTIHDSTNNETYLEIIPHNNFSGEKLYALTQSNAHILCEEPVQITKNNLLYLLCNEELPNLSNYFIYEVSLNTGNIRTIDRCSNQHGREIKTKCD